MKRSNWKWLICAGVLIGVACLAYAAEEAAAEKEKGALPKPLEKSDCDLLKALKGRHSTRAFDTKKAIPADVLATVLWAADGVNRPDGKHTAPSAINIRYMRIYVCRADGAWRYDQDAHKLLPACQEDIRAKIGRQKFMADAQVVLVLTSNLAAFDEKAPKSQAAQRREWSHATAGCIAQNIGLAAEAFGLGSVMAAGVNADEAKKSLALKDDEVPLYIMPLGYPKTE
jgi:nitroreductase